MGAYAPAPRPYRLGMGVGVVGRAGALAALLAVAQIWLAEQLDVTHLTTGYCCGYQRDILPTFADTAWFGALAVAVAVIAVPPVAGRSRLLTVAGAVLGAAAGLPLLAVLAASGPGDSFSAAETRNLMLTYAAGLLLGGLVAVVAAFGHLVVRLGLLAPALLAWTTTIADRYLHTLAIFRPGELQLASSSRAVDALLDSLLVAVCAVAVTVLILLLRNSSWRRPRFWVTLAIGLPLLPAIVWLGIELLSLIPPGAEHWSLRWPVGGLISGSVGVGIALVLRRFGAPWPWLALASVTGYLLLVGSLLLAVTLGPELGGDAALVVDPWNALVGLLVGLIAGGVVGVLSRPREPAPAVSEANG